MSLIFENPQKYMELTAELRRTDKATLNNTLEKIRSMTDKEWEDKLNLLGSLLQDLRVMSGQTLRNFKLGAESNIELIEISNAERGLALPSDDLIRTYIKSINIKG